MPFDSLCLAAAVQDCQTLLGCKITKINQPDKHTIMLRLYGPAGNRRLLLCANPENGRLQLTEHSAENPAKPPLFCMVLRKHLENARLLAVQQVPDERIVRLDFAAHDEIGTPTARTIVLEIMGKHSNLLLLDTPSGQIIDAARRYSHNVSRHREVLPGVTYLAPPADGLKSCGRKKTRTYTGLKSSVSSSFFIAASAASSFLTDSGRLPKIIQSITRSDAWLSI